VGGKAAGKVLGLREKAVAFGNRVMAWPDWKKGLLVAFPLVVAMLLLMLRSAFKAAAGRRASRRLASLVAPSEEHLQEEPELEEEALSEEEALLEEQPLAAEEPSADQEQLAAFPSLAEIEPGEEHEEGFEMDDLPDLEIEIEEPSAEEQAEESLAGGKALDS